MERSPPQYNPARELLPETEQIWLLSLRLLTSSTVNRFLYRFYIDFFKNYLVLRCLVIATENDRDNFYEIYIL